jgi:putative DNA primase/helicase
MTRDEIIAGAGIPDDRRVAEADPAAWDGTDLANGERFVADHGGRLRWCKGVGGWLVYDGTRWRLDDRDQVLELAKSTARHLTHEEATRDVPNETDADRRKRLAKAATFQSVRSIEAMLKLARGGPIAISPDELDTDPWALNTPSGTIDLRTGHVRPHDPGDLITKITAASFDPEAAAPTWDAFTETILPDPDVRIFVQAALGYACTGVIRDHVLPIAWGAGANGKTTLLDAVATVLGDYAQVAPPELIAPRKEQHETIYAALQGARFVTTSELDDGRRLAEATVKRLTGGDKVQARFMRQDFFEIKPTWHLWLATNHRPKINGTDLGLWRRIKLVPFTTTIADHEQDRDLPDKLAKEAAGILTWLLAGVAIWRDNGRRLPDPLAVRMATDDYRAAEDVIGDFLVTCCVLDDTATVVKADLYVAYKLWAADMGERAMTGTRFGRAIGDRAGLDEYRTGKVRSWIGLRLTDDAMTRVTRETA